MPRLLQNFNVATNIFCHSRQKSESFQKSANENLDEVCYINLPNVQNQISPPIITLCASDPVAATGILADSASFAAMVCHGIPVLTTTLNSETTLIDKFHSFYMVPASGQAHTVVIRKLAK